MSKPKQAVILCGGLGTRLRPHTNHVPKPMIICAGKPFLWHLLKQMEGQDIKRFIILTGYLSEQIEGYFGNGDLWGWNIEYSNGPVEWDTGKRIWEAREKLDDRFMLLYSDNFVPFMLDKVVKFHEKNKSALTLVAALKKPGNISLDEAGIVKKYDNNRTTSGHDYVEIGYMIVEKHKTFDFYEFSDCSFSSILQKMAAQHQISACVQNDSYHSISDMNRWEKTDKYLSPNKIILIDRDGVINKKAPRGEYISKWEDFEWIEETRVAMRILAKDGFKFIVISNQAGISRGVIEKDNLEQIHNKMKYELIVDGVEILDIYVCPHHWNDKCWCRKPNPGMLYKASKDYLFRLDKTLFIGDDPRDCQAAWNAGSSSVFIGRKKALGKLKRAELPLISVATMNDSIDAIKQFYYN